MSQRIVQVGWRPKANCLDHLHAAPDPDDARDPRDVLRDAATLDDRAMPRRRAEVLRRSPVRPRRRQAAAHEVGDGIEPGVRLVRRRSGAEPIIALGAIDNLGKGAAGQAVQNANLMLGLPETTGLEGTPLWP